MKRTLILLVVAAIGGLLFANHRVTAAVRNNLEHAADLLAPFGMLDYGDISANPLGKVSVTELGFSPHQSSERYRVGSITLETSSLWTLYQLATGKKGDAFPEQLRLVVKGVHIDMDDETLQTMIDAQPDPFAPFETAGCGDRSVFSLADYSAMGYRELDWDMRFEYQLSPGRDRIEVNIQMAAKGLSTLRIALELNLNESIPNQNPKLARVLAMSAALHSATVEVEDQGYVTRTTDFCAKETGLSTVAYRQQHVKAWQSAWHELSLEDGGSLLAAYKEYYEKPGSTLAVRLRPLPALNLSDAFFERDRDAIYLTQRLNPSIRVNGGKSRRVQLTFIPKEDSETKTEQAASAVPSASLEDELGASPSANRPQSRDAAPRMSRAPIKLTNANLKLHLNNYALITLADGRTYEGRIQKVENSTIYLKRELYGGSMDIPIPLHEIVDVRLQ